MSHFSEEAHFLEVEGMGVVRPLLWGHFSLPPQPLPPDLTHVPGAYEDRDHVGLILLRVLVLHEL